jgi:cell division protein FtsL
MNIARINVWLVVALLACALSLVTSSNRARRAFIGIENAQADTKRIDEEWRRLQLEQGTLAKHGHVEDLAKRELRMRAPDARRLQFVQGDGKASPAPPNVATAPAAAVTPQPPSTGDAPRTTAPEAKQ